MKRPWMPLYVGDYLGDTGHLTTTQHGAYLLLMKHYWRKGGLPDDDGQLAAITGLALREWRSCRPLLQAFFYEGWQHKRIDAELEKMTRISVRRSEAGIQGGIKSALSRMRLEDKGKLRSKDASKREANSKQNPSNCYISAEAQLDHSHSQSKKEEGKEGGSLATALVDSALREPKEGRKQEAASEEHPKRPDQLTREELEAVYAKRRVTA